MTFVLINGQVKQAAKADYFQGRGRPGLETRLKADYLGNLVGAVDLAGLAPRLAPCEHRAALNLDLHEGPRAPRAFRGVNGTEQRPDCYEAEENGRDKKSARWDGPVDWGGGREGKALPECEFSGRFLRFSELDEWRAARFPGIHGREPAFAPRNGVGGASFQRRHLE